MEKVVIETKLKKIPESCAKCSYSYSANSYDVKNSYRLCTAGVYEKPVEKIYIAEKNNYCYVKPTWCPLCMYEVEE